MLCGLTVDKTHKSPFTSGTLHWRDEQGRPPHWGEEREIRLHWREKKGIHAHWKENIGIIPPSGGDTSTSPWTWDVCTAPTTDQSHHENTYHVIPDIQSSVLKHVTKKLCHLGCGRHGKQNKLVFDKDKILLGRLKSSRDNVLYSRASREGYLTLCQSTGVKLLSCQSLIRTEVKQLPCQSLTSTEINHLPRPTSTSRDVKHPPCPTLTSTEVKHLPCHPPCPTLTSTEVKHLPCHPPCPTLTSTEVNHLPCPTLTFTEGYQPPVMYTELAPPRLYDRNLPVSTESPGGTNTSSSSRGKICCMSCSN